PRGCLIRPHQFAGVEVQGDDGVGELGSRWRVLVAGRHVEAFARSIKADGGPDGAAGRTDDGLALLVFALLAGRFRYYPVSPEFLAGGCFQCEDAPPERAANIVRLLKHRAFFVRRNANVDFSLMDD